jgi:fructose-1,6-bisphosphatase/inositol monophosphatase family enzyme
MAVADTITHARLADVTQLLRQVAAAEVMPRFRRLAPGAIRAKSGPLDLVTEADEAAERAIEAGLAKLFPGCVVVGEEGSAADPTVLRHLGDAELAFVVDPIDGTANYAAGVPLFGVMVAVVRRGEIIASVILDPVTDDAVLALRGEGAWSEAADGTHADLLVAAPVPVAEMTGAASWRYFEPPRRERILHSLPLVAAVWDFRCAAHVYRMVAAGQCHFLLFNRLLPWDHAPGWLLHREAGGYAARLDGSAYLPTQIGGGLICTPDRESWLALHAALVG